MKKLILAALMTLSLVGCTSKTQYGECIGVNSEKKPELDYKVSVLNVALAVIFVETIIVPIVVVADQHSCPVGVKKP